MNQLNPSANQPVLQVDNLSVGYKDKTVLRELSFQVEKGSFVSLLGPNGTGKTTLLRTLSRHLSPLYGTVLVDRAELKKLTQKELAKTMSVVLTEKVNPHFFRAWDFVAMGRYPHTGFLGKLTSSDEKAVMEALDMVHAEDLLFRDINTLSDGERQKILIARALAQDPAIILLDEPTMHLDLKHRMEVMAILQSLCRNKGITVIASLHDVDIAAKISDKVALVKDSQIIAWGEPENILSTDSVSSLYDFKGASFNRYLGSIEIRGNCAGKFVFVVAGMSSAAILYRLLSKRGFSIITGILHENDLDFFVANSLGAESYSQLPMNTITTETVQDAKKRISACICVIDTGFPVGELNHGNIDLIKTALEIGCPLYTLRKDDHFSWSVPVSGSNVFPCNSESQLVSLLEERLQNRV
ncbi:MAG: ABC transporter ATP-binding protein [Thermodesulfobacteriota bacterium]|nr:ABC transporter ATP-binding protein [Thermodesulfobacteriota bacterium]